MQTVWITSKRANYLLFEIHARQKKLSGKTIHQLPVE
jgi:hypothetical protein